MTGRSRARDRGRGKSGGAAEWTPWAALGGQWWDAAEGTTGSPVSAWAARGGTATATQGTVANQPAAPATNVNLGGEFASAFDGTDTVVSGTALDMSAAWTVATVLRFGSLRSHTGVFRLSAGELTGADGLALYADSTGRLNVASADASAWYRLGPTSTVASNTSYAILATCSGSSASIVLQVGAISGGSITWSTVTLGSLVGTFAMPAASGRFVQPGGGWAAVSSRLVGDLALTGGVGRVISAGEETTFKGYLAGRFAL
jgi:hypothetical protein